MKVENNQIDNYQYITINFDTGPIYSNVGELHLVFDENDCLIRKHSIIGIGDSREMKCP